MDSKEIRKKFLEFFKKRGHKIIASSSLIPTDSSVLLTTAGMQQFKSYYTGEKDPMVDFGSQRICSIQKSFRTSDIDEVGDESHLTFFEMLGNFSFGPVGDDKPSNFGKDGYFKRAAIYWAHEFITKEMGLKIDYVSIFGGDSKMKLGQKIPPDTESEKIWRNLGVKDVRKFGREDNFWGPTGVEGPCGPTTEIYVNGVEIWNIVFNEYYCLPASSTAGGKTLGVFSSTPSVKEPAVFPAGAFKKLENPGVDTGMGLERLAMVLQGKNNVFETDLFESMMQQISKDSESEDVRRIRIVADHIRAATFIIADGIKPSNTDRGYILRRLLRRARYYYDSIGASNKALGFLVERVAYIYKETDYGLIDKIHNIDSVISDEEMTFSAHLGFGGKLLKKIIEKEGRISGENAFLLYSTHGYPFELILDIAKENKIEVDRKGFRERKNAHQKISKAGQEKKFGGHGLKEGEESSKKLTRLHTATHLLLAALRKILGEEIQQKGSDINEERTRFDFNFSRKLTNEEIGKVEELVNEKIRENLEVVCEEMTLEEAKKMGATGVFEHKYGERVKVYSVGSFSKEICAGPHVENTGEIGNFKIIKEESAAAGIRRVRTVID